MTKKTYLILVFLFLFCSLASAKYSGGSGRLNDPYLIATPNDLNSIGLDPNDWDKHFLMTADINLAGITGNQFNLIGEYTGHPNDITFTGVFDGNNHAIYNFTYIEHDMPIIGLFRCVDDPCSIIKNVNMINANISLTGSLYWGTGALIGNLNKGQVLNCNVINGKVNACNYAGGLIGDVGNGSISNCSSSSIVSGDHYVGALVGNSQSGTIQRCFAIGDVNARDGVGGLVGRNVGHIKDSFANVSTNGEGWVGGLVGEQYGDVSKCYSAGTVEGDMSWIVGGLAGQGEPNDVTESFWDIETSDCNTSDGGTGLNTAQMQKRCTFADAGWNMINVWDIGENQTYPFLRTHLPSDINKDDQTNFLDLALLAQNWLKN